jgi:NADH-quinone oxidoreductase subunit M
MLYRHWAVTILLAWPLLAGISILLVPTRLAKHVALAATLIEVAIALPLWWLFDPQLGSQFGIDLPWVRGWGIRYSVGVDGISLVLVLLTVCLMPLVAITHCSSCSPPVCWACSWRWTCSCFT